MGSKYQDPRVLAVLGGGGGGTDILPKGPWHVPGVSLGVEFGSLAAFFSTSIKKDFLTNTCMLFLKPFFLTSYSDLDHVLSCLHLALDLRIKTHARTRP